MSSDTDIPVDFPCLNIDVSQFPNAGLQNAFLEIGAAFDSLGAFADIQGQDPFIQFDAGKKDIFGTIGKGTVSHINTAKLADAVNAVTVAGSAAGKVVIGGKLDSAKHVQALALADISDLLNIQKLNDWIKITKTGKDAYVGHDVPAVTGVTHNQGAILEGFTVRVKLDAQNHTVGGDAGTIEGDGTWITDLWTDALGGGGKYTVSHGVSAEVGTAATEAAGYGGANFLTVALKDSKNHLMSVQSRAITHDAWITYDGSGKWGHDTSSTVNDTLSATAGYYISGIDRDAKNHVLGIDQTALPAAGSANYIGDYHLHASAYEDAWISVDNGEDPPELYHVETGAGLHLDKWAVTYSPDGTYPHDLVINFDICGHFTGYTFDGGARQWN